MTAHIDTLKEWWENAEEGVIEKGDTVINRSESETTVYVATVRARHQHPSARILARAPKPKPAWHDAVAVIATYDDHVDQETFRGVWTPDGDGIWQHEDGVVAGADALTDVTPLIEAKVTDEMVIRARGSLRRATGYDYAYATVQDALTAALGLETA